MNDNELILKHYKEQAEKYGDSSDSTMQDIIVRKKELELINDYFRIISIKTEFKVLKILDLGCGNGGTLEKLIEKYPSSKYWGIDYSRDMLEIAKNRNIDCKFVEGNCRKLDFDTGYFDVIYTERCLINVLNWKEQRKALHEIHRLLNDEGRYLMIECFEDGHLNYNRARVECGLDAIKEAYHNKYINKELFLEEIKDLFYHELFAPEDLHYINSNFLSSHYFISRVLYPLITKREFIRNTEFVKFFSFLPGNIGNYSPLQVFFLKKQKGN